MIVAEGKTNLFVILEHPHGKLEVPLENWCRNGPGPRVYLRPIEVRRRGNDERLPLRILPFRYRNTPLSRFLIRVGLMSDPWSAQRPSTQD